MNRRYRLVSVKFSRREQKVDDSGKLVFKEDGDKKVPVYDLKSYAPPDIVELSTSEARRLRNDIRPVGGTVEEPANLSVDLIPDEEPDVSILDRNAPEVVEYLDTIADDEDALNTLRDAEEKGKNRKSVLDAIDSLIGE